ncbi:MAG: hypothetical protein HS116_18815 [Planctomycetes bacterium]|nr:hypothetical protein [Planctomycetota bacterium]
MVISSRTYQRIVWFGVCWLLPLALQAEETDVLVLPDRAPDAVRWAAGEVLSVLERSGALAGLPPHSIRVGISASGSALGVEAYDLSAPTDGPITIRGGDGPGAMYGLLELAEQLSVSQPREDWKSVRARLVSRAQRPFVALRALNLFLHVDAQGKPAVWFEDAECWSKLLTLLAYSRFNLIDLHGTYQPQSTAFGDAVVLLGGAGEDAARYRAVLKRIVEHASARGIRVGLMNYGRGKEDRIEDDASAVERIVRDVPGLAWFGARLKRSGADGVKFFEEVYVEPARRAGFQGAFYTRSWGTDLDTVRKLSRAAGGALGVELKFNGEHLGLPYPAVHGRGEDYGFQDFLLPNRNFEPIWQVRAAGTHRVFQWADPEFIRTAARSFRLGAARGFSVEPIWAYGPPELSARHRNPPPGLRYEFELNADFYRTWGRLAYDPLESNGVLARGAVQRHGPEFGPLAFALLARMSRIVPQVYAGACAGLDHRESAPELEPGLLERGKSGAPRSLEAWAALSPLDGARGCSPLEWAAAVAEGRQEWRESPWQAAATLDSDAAAVHREANALLARIDGAPAPEALIELCAEARALAALGASTAARWRALSAWALHRKGVDPLWARIAADEMNASVTAWRVLANESDRVFLPVQDPLRAGADFTWSSMTPRLERVAESLQRLAERGKDGTDRVALPRLWERATQTPADLDVPGLQWELQEGKTRIELRFPPQGRQPVGIEVLFKPLRSERDWEARSFRGSSGLYTINLPAPPGGLLVRFRGADAQGRGWQWPDLKKGLPYVWTAGPP